MNGNFTDGVDRLVIYKGNSFEEVKAIVEVDPYIKNETEAVTYMN